MGPGGGAAARGPVRGGTHALRGWRPAYLCVVYKETGDEELYDRQSDPYELTNVAADPAHAAIKAKLAAALVKLDRCRGRSCRVTL